VPRPGEGRRGDEHDARSAPSSRSEQIRVAKRAARDRVFACHGRMTSSGCRLFIAPHHPTIVEEIGPNSCLRCSLASVYKNQMKKGPACIGLSLCTILP
jgi:hypothetical protein